MKTKIKLDFYLENREELDNWNKGGGRQQTLFNFLLQINNYDVKLLPPIWNMFAMHKKDMFSHNFQDGDDKTPHFIKYDENTKHAPLIFGLLI